MKKIVRRALWGGVGACLFLAPLNMVAQENNPISTVVPFLNFAPDSRSSGMGDVGVATSPDINSQHWNAAKYSFMEGDMGVSFSVTPWLRKLVDDINLFYVAGYYKIDKMQTISGSLRYFSLGEISYTTEEGDALPYTGKPNEFALDVAYSRLLSEKFSGAITMRYIRSDLSQGAGSSTSEELKAGNSFAADVAFYFRHQTTIDRKKADITAGLLISNIGSKISYDDQYKEYLPANLKLGGGIAYEIDRYNKVAFTLEFNKLLVPTPQEDQSLEEYRDQSVPASIFKSFNDAPGGFSEELREVNIGAGIEYIYNDAFALRAGYFHEHETKGNRKLASAGAGLKFNMITIDASYVIPVVANNPLANTVRLTLGFDLSKMSKRK